MVSRDSFSSAIEALKAGDPIIFPTDTVYGLGVAVAYAESPSALFTIKKRPGSKPIPWLVGSVKDAEIYGTDLSPQAKRLITENWPGALTVIVKASPKVPKAYVSTTGTIGLRMAASSTVLALIDGVGCPLATTSANLSGSPAPRNPDELDPHLLALVSAALVQPVPLGNTPSTVIDCTGRTPKVLRP